MYANHFTFLPEGPRSNKRTRDGRPGYSTRLEPGVTLVGRVTDVKGKPIVKAEVRLNLRTESVSTQFGSTVQSDAEGRFEINALPKEQRFYFCASAKGYGQENRNIDEPDTNRIELEPIQLELADQPIAGIVLDEKEKPVAHAYINVYGKGQPSYNGQSDAKGRFSLQVCSGRVQLSANDPRGDGYANMNVESGDTNITIRISARPVSSRRAPAPRRHASKLEGPRRPRCQNPLPHLSEINFRPHGVANPEFHSQHGHSRARMQKTESLGQKLSRFIPGCRRCSWQSASHRSANGSTAFSVPIFLVDLIWARNAPSAAIFGHVE